MSLAEKTFRKGEVIIKEGDIGKTLFYINEGKVGVYTDYGKKNRFSLGFLGAGEFFGEMAILEAYPRSATIVAEKDTVAVEIPGDDMNAYFSENPDQIIVLMKLLGDRIQTMAADYSESQVLLKQLREADEGK